MVITVGWEFFVWHIFTAFVSQATLTKLNFYRNLSDILPKELIKQAVIQTMPTGQAIKESENIFQTEGHFQKIMKTFANGKCPVLQYKQRCWGYNNLLVQVAVMAQALGAFRFVQDLVQLLTLVFTEPLPYSPITRKGGQA